MDLLAEYASDSESSSSTSDGNERETVNADKDLNGRFYARDVKVV